MANPHKGEVSFTIEGETYKMSYSADALAELEDALGMTVNEISTVMQDTAKFKIGMIRTVFWAGLLDHQEDMKMPDARRLLKRMKVAEVSDLVGRAFTLAFPDAEDGNAAENPPKPDSQKAAPAGTGPAS